MNRIFPFLITALLIAGARAQSPLTVSEARASQRAGTKLVDISYDVSGGTPPYTVSLQGSLDGGQTWTLPVTTLTGHVGSGVAPGTNRLVTWNAGLDWDGKYDHWVRFRVSATDSGLSAPILLSPANNSIKYYTAPATPRHTFTWQSVNGADSYRLVVTRRGGVVVVDEIVNALTFTPDLDLYTVTWQVYAIKNGVSSPSSAVWTARVVVFQ